MLVLESSEMWKIPQENLEVFFAGKVVDKWWVVAGKILERNLLPVNDEFPWVSKGPSFSSTNASTNGGHEAKSGQLLISAEPPCKSTKLLPPKNDPTSINPTRVNIPKKSGKAKVSRSEHDLLSWWLFHFHVNVDSRRVIDSPARNPLAIFHARCINRPSSALRPCQPWPRLQPGHLVSISLPNKPLRPQCWGCTSPIQMAEKTWKNHMIFWDHVSTPHVSPIFVFFLFFCCLAFG